MYWKSNITASGFFVFEGEGGWECPASAELALTSKSFFLDLGGRQGMKFPEPHGRVANAEDSAAGHVRTWTIGFPTIIYTIPVESMSYIDNTVDII